MYKIAFSMKRTLFATFVTLDINVDYILFNTFGWKQ